MLLKKCLNANCSQIFPEHYYNDYCIAHSDSADNAKAVQRANTMTGDQSYWGKASYGLYPLYLKVLATLRSNFRY